VEHVRDYVSGLALRTPCFPSEWLGSLIGGQVWLKCENLQVTGSFKVRGPLARLPWLNRDQRLCGAICASAGNHGKGLAWAARQYKIRCVVCVPRSIPENKEAGIRALGAQVIKAPFDGYDDTSEYAQKLAQKTGGVWVSPFDDDHIMAGNGGTTAMEIFEDLPSLDAIVAPCGGGGLAVGLGVVARAKSPGTRIIGVNAEASPAMWMSRRDGRPCLRVDWKPTIAEGLEGGVSENSYKLGLEYIHEVVVAKEESIRKAVAGLLRHHRMAVEGSGAAPVAAFLDGLLPGGLKRVCVVLSGSNIDASRLKEIVAAEF